MSAFPRPSSLDLQNSPGRAGSEGRLDQIRQPSIPYRIILVKAGKFTGILPNGMSVKDCDRFQDTNPKNPADYYVYTGLNLLFDVSNGEVFDLRNNNVEVTFPCP